MQPKACEPMLLSVPTVSSRSSKDFRSTVPEALYQGRQEGANGILGRLVFLSQCLPLLLDHGPDKAGRVETWWNRLTHL